VITAAQIDVKLHPIGFINRSRAILSTYVVSVIVEALLIQLTKCVMNFFCRKWNKRSCRSWHVRYANIQFREPLNWAVSVDVLFP
jgi:hypothetical protein